VKAQAIRKGVDRKRGAALRFRFGAAFAAALLLFNVAGAWEHETLESVGAVLGGGVVGAGSAVVGALVVGSVWHFDSPSGDLYDPSPLLPLVIGAAAGAVLGYPCGCAIGTATVGNWNDWEGNPGLAYAGAYVGLPVGIGLAWLGAVVSEPSWSIPLCIAGALAPPAGAVIGYNLHARKQRPPSPLGARVSLPTVAFSALSGQGRERVVSFDCRLVTVRF